MLHTTVRLFKKFCSVNGASFVVHLFHLPWLNDDGLNAHGHVLHCGVLIFYRMNPGLRTAYH